MALLTGFESSPDLELNRIFPSNSPFWASLIPKLCFLYLTWTYIHIFSLCFIFICLFYLQVLFSIASLVRSPMRYHFLYCREIIKPLTAPYSHVFIVTSLCICVTEEAFCILIQDIYVILTVLFIVNLSLGKIVYYCCCDCIYCRFGSNKTNYKI